MKKLMTLLLALFLFSTLCPVSAQAAAWDEAYLEPKFLEYAPDQQASQAFPVYEPQLISLLRTAAAEAYNVNRDDLGREAELIRNMGALGFTDCTSLTVDGGGVTYHPTDASFEEETKPVVLVCSLFTAVRKFTVDGAEKKLLLISIRGTVPGIDLVTDALIGDEHGFHAGFYNSAYKAYLGLHQQSFPSLGMTFDEVLKQAADPDSGCYILVTGHSLGAAVASILTAQYINQATKNIYNTLCCTFASPLVCSAERAAALTDDNILTVVNDSDTVPCVGYLLTVGVKLGHIISAHSDQSQQGSVMDAIFKHSINYIYKDIVSQLNAAPETYYHYAHTTENEPGQILLGAWSNQEHGTRILPAVERRFDPYGVRLQEYANLTLQGNDLRSLAVAGGQLYCADSSTIREDLLIGNGALVLGSGTLTVKGDLRLQRPAAEGYAGGEGILRMEEASGRLIVCGDAYFQGGQSSLTAGTLELKGDLFVLPSTGGQAEQIFLARDDHVVLLSGDAPQTLSFAPSEGADSYLSSAIRILRSTNPHPICAPYPIRLDLIPEDLTFSGVLALDGLGDSLLTVPEDAAVTIKANHVTLTNAALPKVYGSLTFDCSVSGGSIQIGSRNGPIAQLTVNGDLTGTALRFFGTEADHNLATIRGDYAPLGSDLTLCNGHLTVEGDLVCRTVLEDGSFVPSGPRTASVYDGARVTVCGDLLLAGSSADQNLGFSKECAVVLRGDLLQSPAGEGIAMISGLSRLVLASEKRQTVDAPQLYFTDILLANTSREGVDFKHALYGLSGIFNAYGRADGTITPYRFPKGILPDEKDSDGDGIPDCLDPTPTEADLFSGLAAAISDGTQDGELVRFLYYAPADTASEGTTVLLALYSGGSQVALSTIQLNAAPGQLRELEISLAGKYHVDSVKIFQLNLECGGPVWSAAAWGAQ